MQVALHWWLPHWPLQPVALLLKFGLTNSILPIRRWDGLSEPHSGALHWPWYLAVRWWISSALDGSYCIAFICHVIGIVMTIFATGFWTLFVSTLFVGIGNGSVEAACNPLITSMYTEEKTRRLNRFHAWFPTGIVIGGLMVYIFTKSGITDWRYSMGAMLIPTLWYGIWFLNKKFPQTERVVSGFTYKQMLKACVSPLFIFMACCMILTAATELGTNQWIAALMSNVTDSPILLLVWISGIMALATSVWRNPHS